MGKIPLEALQDFTLASGITPLNSDHAAILSEACALVHFMGAAFEDSKRLIDQDKGGEVNACSASVIVSLFNGLETLIALGCYMADETVQSARTKATEGRANG